MPFFKDDCLTTTNAGKFGIIDDNQAPESPAYLSHNTGEDWSVIVDNPTQKTLNFYAIDKCILFYKVNNPGNLESTCDAALVDINTIYFIEIKDRSSSGWLAKACDQIINTIKLLKENTAPETAPRIIGYVCNSQRPNANSSHTATMARFYRETNGCKLFVQQVLHIE